MRTITITDDWPGLFDSLQKTQDDPLRSLCDEHGLIVLNAIEQSPRPNANVTVTVARFASPKPLSADQAEDIRWYLEDYVTQDSFRSTRAARASERLQAHRKEITKNIPWCHFFEPGDTPEALSIHLQLKDESCCGIIMWETIEDTRQWEYFVPERVFVSRRKQSLSLEVSNIGSGHVQANPLALNVLVFVARPHGGEDIPHRLVTHAIMDVIKTWPSSSPCPVTLEVVRPGTFSALKKHLERRPIGYFQYIHLDVHGSEQVSGR